MYADHNSVTYYLVKSEPKRVDAYVVAVQCLISVVQHVSAQEYLALVEPLANINLIAKELKSAFHVHVVRLANTNPTAGRSFANVALAGQLVHSSRIAGRSFVNVVHVERWELSNQTAERSFVNAALVGQSVHSNRIAGRSFVNVVHVERLELSNQTAERSFVNAALAEQSVHSSRIAAALLKGKPVQTA